MKLNITDKLTSERPVLEIGTERFEVNNTKDAVLRFQELDEKGKSTTALISEALVLFLGEEGAARIDRMGFSYKSTEKIFIAVLALATEDDIEEVERRFQGGISAK